MKCKEVQALLSPYMDGELEEAKIPLIQEHLNTCKECMELYQSWQTIEDLTKQTLIGTEPSEDYWNSFTYRLHWRINKDKANKVAAKQVWWRRIFAPTFTRSLSGVAVVFIMLLFGLDYHKKQSQLPLSPVNTIDGTLYYDDMKSITRDERKTYLVDEEFASETIEDISSAPLLASETGKLITTEFARGIEAEAPIDDYFTEPETPVPTTEIARSDKEYEDADGKNYPKEAMATDLHTKKGDGKPEKSKIEIADVPKNGEYTTLTAADSHIIEKDAEGKTTGKDDIHFAMTGGAIEQDTIKENNSLKEDLDIAKGIDSLYITNAIRVDTSADTEEINLYQQGAIAQNKQNINEAITNYQNLLDQYPDSELAPITSYNLLQCQIPQMNLEEQKKAWQDYLTEYDDTEIPAEAKMEYAEITYNFANVKRRIEDYEEALDAYETCQEIFPKHHSNQIIINTRLQSITDSLQIFFSPRRATTLEEAETR